MPHILVGIAFKEKKKEFRLLPSHPSTMFRILPSYSWSKMADRIPIFISRPGWRELGRSQ